MLVIPAAAHIFPAVEIGHIGFDIEERGLVENVHFGEIDPLTLQSFKFDDGETKFVESLVVPGGKAPVVHILKVRLVDQLLFGYGVEVIKKSRWENMSTPFRQSVNSSKISAYPVSSGLNIPWIGIPLGSL
jgi:hypothetical protein